MPTRQDPKRRVGGTFFDEPDSDDVPNETYAETSPGEPAEELAPALTSTSTPTSAAAKAGVLLTFVGFTTFISLIYWPGQIDPDSIDEIHQAASGHFNDWHAPLLAALWRGPYLLGLQSPGWVLAAGVFVLLIGLYLMLRIRFSPPWATTIALLVCAYPPVFSWAVHISRDAWFTAFFLCAFGFAARIVRTGRDHRSFNVAACLIAAALADACRQNVLPSLVVLLVVLVAALIPAGRPRRWLVSIVSGVALGILLFVVQLGALSAIGTTHLHPEQSTYTYDLAQLSKMEHKDLFPRQDLIRGRNTGAALDAVEPGTYDVLVWGSKPVIKFPLKERSVGVLRSRWESAIVHDPAGYLRERLALAEAQLAITRPSLWVFEWPPDPTGFRPVSSTLRTVGVDYLKPFSINDNNTTGGPLYTAWVYVLLLGISIPILLRRRRAGDWVVASAAISMLIYEVSVFFTAPDLEYRFAYPMVVMATVIAPMLLPYRTKEIVASGSVDVSAADDRTPPPVRTGPWWSRSTRPPRTWPPSPDPVVSTELTSGDGSVGADRP